MEEGMLFTELRDKILIREYDLAYPDKNVPSMNYEQVGVLFAMSQLSGVETLGDVKAILLIERENLKKDVYKEHPLYNKMADSGVEVIKRLYEIFKVGYSINHELPEGETLSAEAIKVYSEIVGTSSNGSKDII